MPEPRPLSNRAHFEARARHYFGDNNTAAMEAVHLANDVVALIQGERLWLYQEGPSGRPSGLAVRLTTRRRRAVIDALSRASESKTHA